jgi:choline-glycine betaine transporter
MRTLCGKVETTFLGNLYVRESIVDNIIKRIGTSLGDFWNSLLYSVDHMTPTNWAIFGVVSVAVGFMLLRSQRF